jgi:hypothetical protein
MPSKTWTPEANCPTTMEDFKKALTALAKLRKGKKLISAKFTKDHIFAGHGGDVTKLAAMLAKLRELPNSTIMISSLDATSQAEVLNWIKESPAARFAYSDGTWTILAPGSAVEAANSYKFATVDLEELKGMNSDDVVKKSRNWLTVSQKTPKVACQFDDDGTPVIYHLDY